MSRSQRRSGSSLLFRPCDFLLLVLNWLAISIIAESWTPVSVKNVTLLGFQQTPNITNVSRDGGHSVLLNQRVTWLYDDTQCMSETGKLLSFISNTAAYSGLLGQNSTTVEDFGVVTVGKDSYGTAQNAILGDSVVGDGGWVPFSQDEAQFNSEKKGIERIAIWPGTSPTPINTTHALLYAPLVYVDSKPENPAEEYTARGTTLILISASDTGPEASRLEELIFPDEEIQFGAFASVIGDASLESSEQGRPQGDADVYLFGATDAGLQLARVPLSRVSNIDAYTYFAPRNTSFSASPPSSDLSEAGDIYMDGTFSSGNVFFSPYFKTWLLVYFNKMADSIFYYRFLDLEQPRNATTTRWKQGGKDGTGITSADAEALVQYMWSDQQTLYESTPGPGGFNYAGAIHAEYFNRQYYPDMSQFDPPPGTSIVGQNGWYGGDEVDEEKAGGDGKYMMLSWTYQQHGGLDTGIYKIMMARLQFDDIPPRPNLPSTTSIVTSHLPASTHTGISSTHTRRPSAGGSRHAKLPSFLGLDHVRVLESRSTLCELSILIGMMMGIIAVF